MNSGNVVKSPIVKKNRHLFTDRAFTKRVRAFKIELEFESVGF